VMITATNRFIVDPIAEEFGINSVIATEPEMVDGRFTGRVSGLPCFREGKIARFEQWLAKRGQSPIDTREIWFYSDSHNDLPLLSRATHPVCVGPDPKLAAHAAQHGWPIIELNGERALHKSG
jgi:HAD superfamily phosphoserine phosphatase-like hydrolase